MPHKSSSELIFDHALRFVQPLRTTDGHAWAVIPDGPLTHHGEPIDSREFREWLAAHFYHEHGIYPGKQSLTGAIHMLRAQANRSTAPAEHIFTRLGYRGRDAILLHLANSPHNEVLEITAAGSRLTTAPNWQFRTSAATAALPRPIPSGLTVLQHLRAMLDLPDPVLHRAAIWLHAAMRPSGPYPMLIITGQEESGATLARTLRDLIDPTSSYLTIPRSERALHTCALHHHVLAFQNAGSLSAQMPAALAALASGSGVAFYSGNPLDDHKPIPLARPIIITAPSVPRTFAANSIHIRLQTTATENVITENACAAFLGSLSTAVTAALASGHTDIRRWTSAAAAQLGLTLEQIDAVFIPTPLIDAIQTLLATEPNWSGTPTELLTELRTVDFKTTNAQSLSRLLNAAPLDNFGIQLVHRWTKNSRLIHLSKPPTQYQQNCVGAAQSRTLTHAESAA